MSLFVVSGFLIGGIILRQRSSADFSYRNFYARRARRILPALFAVIVFSMVAGWLMMMPHDLRYFGGAAMATLLFISNIWFFEVIDYFNPAALRDPLIHTWSLAVEEQFYFFVPLLFGILWRFGQKAVFWVFAALALISLTAAILTNVNQPMAAFYLIHTRAWELFAGVLAALVFPKINLPERSAGWLSNLGLLMIVGSLGFTPAHVPWPGVWTIIPVAGTALVLLFGQAPSLARSLLRFRPLAIIGLISYSAYLWHQPMISFLDMAGYSLAGWPQITIAVMAIIAVSWLSWRFIEQPFRNSSNLSKGVVRGSLTLTGLMIAVFAIGGHVTKGYPDRMTADVHRILAYANSHSEKYEKCAAASRSVLTLDINERCVHGADSQPSIAIWGDSHAARLSQPLGDALIAHGLSMRELTLYGCQPIPNLLNYGQKRKNTCLQNNKNVLEYLLATPSINVVILNANWQSYFINSDSLKWIGGYNRDGFYSYPSDWDPMKDDTSRKAAIADKMIAAINTLKEAGKTVIILQNIPYPGFRLTKYYGRKIWYGETIQQDIGFPKTLHSAASADIDRIFNKVSRETGAIAVDPQGLFCPDENCYVMRSGDLLYSDGNHLSLPGISLIIPELVSTILAASTEQHALNR